MRFLEQLSRHLSTDKMIILNSSKHGQCFIYITIKTLFCQQYHPWAYEMPLLRHYCFSSIVIPNSFALDQGLHFMTQKK